MTLIRVKRVSSASYLNESFVVYDVNAQGTVPAMLTKSGRLTGLTPEEETQFEEKLGLDKGELKKTSKFWDNYYIKLTGKSFALNDDYPSDELAIKVLKAQVGLVAPNAQALKSPGYSKAEFVLVEAEAEAKAENVTFKHKKKAFKLLEELSLEDMRQVLMVMGKPAKGLGNEQIENSIQKELERDPKRFIEILEDPTRTMRIFISECASEGILERRGSGYSYSGELVAPSIESMVDFLNNKENNQMLFTLKQRLAEIKK